MNKDMQDHAHGVSCLSLCPGLVCTSCLTYQTLSIYDYVIYWPACAICVKLAIY